MERLRKTRNPLLLFIGVTGLITLTAFINIVPPDSITAMLIFAFLFIATLVLLGLYTIRSLRHVLILTFGITLYLILRFFGLRHPLYAVLLAASIAALEFLLRDTS